MKKLAHSFLMKLLLVLFSANLCMPGMVYAMGKTLSETEKKNNGLSEILKNLNNLKLFPLIVCICLMCWQLNGIYSDYNESNVKSRIILVKRLRIPEVNVLFNFDDYYKINYKLLIHNYLIFLV